jgi:alanyl-tRNA synthetase
MNAKELRQSFLDFFASKQHKIVSSAPMVIKGDPTLMFTNAGMNQFKEAFLGTGNPPANRVADTQKCLRVSGKHNDLEEVGHDTYHHTMFEMLGNWSFGDYFKKEAIEWGWEYLTEVLKIDKDRLYVSVFEGAEEDGLGRDDEAAEIWEQRIDKNRIINGNKKDNFWEMGEQGPCGPCSEIHVDLRNDEDRAKVDGKTLVNEDHPLVVEIWNLVFIQFNRKANGDLEKLPAQHVDTGMGFERLAMTVQGKESNYDTDIFQPLIQKIAKLSNLTYGKNEEQDIAMRVVSDHLRAVAFSIADGQLPSNTGAGYVIRRILRRAVRYAYTFLGQEEAVLYKMFPVLLEEMGQAYPELEKQKSIIEKVILEEEQSFLRTLAKGIKILEGAVEKLDGKTILDGKTAFELYDTYGFPLDLTELILREKGMEVDEDGFNAAMAEQKNRSRKDAEVATDDWTILNETTDIDFEGYDALSCQSNLLRYRKTKVKGKDIFHLVFDKTPFYGEGGGQAGDAGVIELDGKKIGIFDTQKEHGLIIHYTKELPEVLDKPMLLQVSGNKRSSTAIHHTAAHLVHYALREVLGKHVEQKGSSVNEKVTRFDFSHFQKMTVEEIAKTEALVNEIIRANYPLEENREASMAEAENMGALALFGEKYGDKVRVVKFGDSVELCGGTHAKATGDLGLFKIITETSIAAGIRRVEAVVGFEAEKYINSKIETLNKIEAEIKSSGDVLKQVEALLAENQKQKKQIEQFQKAASGQIKDGLKQSVEQIGDINFIAKKIDADNAGVLKDIAFQLKGEIQNLVLVLGADLGGKANLTIMISDNLVKSNDLHAGNMVRELAKNIQGGGGGQPFFASAGGKNPDGIDKALEEAKNLIVNC